MQPVGCFSRLFGIFVQGGHGGEDSLCYNSRREGRGVDWVIAELYSEESPNTEGQQAG